METTTKTQTAECPECGATIELSDKIERGEILQCPDCGAELEVIKVEPQVELALAPEEEEDWGE